ncbi:hypothetical protein [Leptolyngbya sp. FACHB-261]|nr:hypothetical protein [Leptolyngbya sp. FACHB-261]
MVKAADPLEEALAQLKRELQTQLSEAELAQVELEPGRSKKNLKI